VKIFGTSGEQEVWYNKIGYWKKFVILLKTSAGEFGNFGCWKWKSKFTQGRRKWMLCSQQ
jgi:hypothetical protein